MASSCPKCHRLVEEDEICCAQVRHTWRCRSCCKLTTGSVVPYGKCYLCGGELEVMQDRDMGDSMRFHAIRDAVQLELDLFHFYRRARERATQPAQCLVLEYLCEIALDRLYELEERYRAQLNWEMVKIASNEERLLSDWPFPGIRVNEGTGLAELYDAALAIERRAREHFRNLESERPGALEAELCKELAAEADEHIAMLETELEQLT